MIKPVIQVKSKDENETKPSQIGPELGTAQPQLVLSFIEFYYFGVVIFVKF